MKHQQHLRRKQFYLIEKLGVVLSSRTTGSSSWEGRLVEEDLALVLTAESLEEHAGSGGFSVDNI